MFLDNNSHKMGRCNVLIITLLICVTNSMALKPLIVTTWNFEQAGQKAWEYVVKNESAVDALVVGCGVCEELQCDFTVGYGGSPDENGETRLDAMIFDGKNMDMGAVASMGKIKNAIGVAKNVLENTEHSLIVGDLATNFALEMGFKEESLQTSYSKQLWSDWKENKCQPNFWKNVVPDPDSSCGPYQPISENDVLYDYDKSKNKELFNSGNHDTISMIIIDNNNNIVAGTSTNGAKFKIPGRVGDSPIPGAGAYADNEVGAAVGTGDGDVMMRFLPAFLAVEEMRRGSTPENAAATAIERIRRYYPNFFGAVIAANKDGEYGAACNGMTEFPYVVGNSEFDGVKLLKKTC